MSLLRKRSPWILPAAGVLLGALTLGMVGCGGGDDAPFLPPDIDTFTVIPLPPQQSQGSASFSAGEGGTVRATNLLPNETGGITGIQIEVPPGIVGADTTLGIAVVNPNQHTVARTRAVNPNALGRTIGDVVTIAEYVFGSVNPDGTVDPNGAPDGPVDTVILLSDAQANLLSSQLGDVHAIRASEEASHRGNRAMQLFRIRGNQGTADPNCEIQFIKQPGNSRITITKCRGGHAIVTHRPRNHVQGGGHSGQ